MSHGINSKIIDIMILEFQYNRYTKNHSQYANPLSNHV